jgi:3-isopropylmalate/(R)-2-methylmalate dehydratase large subunit
MHVIRRLGAGAAIGLAVEFAGSAIQDLDAAGGMAVSSMAVDMASRAALIAPDERGLRSTG